MEKNTITYKQFSFNGLKHHLNFTKEYFENKKLQFDTNSGLIELLCELKTTGNNITDIYTGILSIQNLFKEISYNLKQSNYFEYNEFIKLFIHNDYFKIEIPVVQYG